MKRIHYRFEEPEEINDWEIEELINDIDTEDLYTEEVLQYETRIAYLKGIIGMFVIALLVKLFLLAMPTLVCCSLPQPYQDNTLVVACIPTK